MLKRTRDCTSTVAILSALMELSVPSEVVIRTLTLFTKVAPSSAVISTVVVSPFNSVLNVPVASPCVTVAPTPAVNGCDALVVNVQ